MLNLIADMLLPPASLAVAALVLLAFGRVGRRISAGLLVILVLLGLPVVSTTLLNSLAPPPQEQPADPPQAIVILSGDAVRMQGAVDLEPGPISLDRLRAGAALARRTGLPVLVSGGEFLDAKTRLSTMMANSLRDDFRVPVRWEEDRSRDTWQNAEYSAAILHAAGISRIYLVTHDWHMRRALLAFRDFGLDPVPLPVRPAETLPFSWRGLVINAASWLNSYLALHEWVGLAYYSLR